MRMNGNSIEFTTSEQDLGLPESVAAGDAMTLIFALHDRKKQVYEAACQPAAPGVETESRSAAFCYASDLGMVAHRLARLVGFDTPVILDEDLEV
jgi:hypothetical protein